MRSPDFWLGSGLRFSSFHEPTTSYEPMTTLTRSEGIQNLLRDQNSIFADRYHPGFETQVLSVDKEKHYDIHEKFCDIHDFRTCKKLNEHEFICTGDKPLFYPLRIAASLIGISGWNVKEKLSYGVGFDFDHVANHPGTGTSNLETILEDSKQLPYVSINTSKSNTGYHVWVWFTEPVAIKTRPEQKALGRAVLQKISYDIGYDLDADVDAYGGNMWIWSRDAAPDGLTPIKQGIPLEDVPDWRPHLDVVAGKRRRTRLHDNEDDFDYPRERLDADHRRIIDALHATGYATTWNHDHHCVVTHTVALKQVHEQLNLKGIFETNSPGLDTIKPNCFAVVAPNGAWRVYRFSKDCTESGTWESSTEGWTHCNFNTVPTFSETARACNASLLPSTSTEGIIFPSPEQAAKGLQAYGVTVEFPSFAENREVTLKRKKRQMILEFQRVDEIDDSSDSKRTGWHKARGVWARTVDAMIERGEPNFAAMARGRVRYLSEDGEGQGFVVMTNQGWETRPVGMVKDQLSKNGIRGEVQNELVGWCSENPYRLVSIPFGPEYPGNRTWNKGSAQLKYQHSPRPGDTPFWDKVMSHLGKGLDDAVMVDDRCAQLGITDGKDYLERWVANVIRNPQRRLPILAMYSPEQDTGKSTLHYGLEQIVTERGVQQADKALRNERGFNVELKGAPICVIEELNLAKEPHAYDRLKSWNTNLTLGYEDKGETVFKFLNYMHFIICVNKRHYIPIEDGDKRFVVWRVSRLTAAEKIEDRDWLFGQLRKEAPFFLHRLFQLDLDTVVDRHTLPVLMTLDKQEMMETAKMAEVPLDGRRLALATAIARLKKPITLTATQLLPKVGNWDKEEGAKSDAARVISLGIKIKDIAPHMPEFFNTNIKIRPTRNNSNEYVITKA